MKRLPLLLALAGAGCHKEPTPTKCPEPQLDAVRVQGEVKIDGNLDEPQWRVSSSGAFKLLKEGTATSPHSELRALWNKDALFLGLYAADEDLRSDDMFLVKLEPGPTLRVAPKGGLSCVGGCRAEGLRAAFDVDGTFDDPSDEDEEWIAEVAIPWAVLGLPSPADVRLNVWRTDTPKGGRPRTVAWACQSEQALGRLHLR